jgi:hypothetical protein
MSALTHKSLAVIVRHQAGLPPHERLGLQALINPTLKQLARDVALDRRSRNFLLTDPATTTVTLDANGVADLSSLVSSQKILLDRLKFGEITHPDSDLPLDFIESSDLGGLDGGLDELFVQCWLTGTLLYTKNTGADALSGDLSLAVPYIPTLLQLPEALEPKLIDMLVERVKIGRNVRDESDDE